MRGSNIHRSNIKDSNIKGSNINRSNIKGSNINSSKFLTAALAWVLWSGATPALAFVYVSISGSDSSSNGGLQTYGSIGGSASISFDLASFLRLGYTYKQEYQTANGFAGATSSDCTDIDNLNNCETYSSSTRQVANSVDLTILLYQGQTFTPFLLAGAIKKDYETKTQTGTVESDVNYSQKIPQPNGGAGLYIRMTKDFSLKITYTVSPGQRLEDPISKKIDSVLDKETDVGISYQL
jgi:hypothetical protein